MYSIWITRANGRIVGRCGLTYQAVCQIAANTRANASIKVDGEEVGTVFQRDGRWLWWVEKLE